jgi:Flp pilus assembly protein TadB
VTRWVIAGGYVGAAALLAAGLMSRFDPGVRARLGLPGSRNGGSVLEAMGGRIHARRARKRVTDRLGGAGATEVDRVMGQKLAAAIVGAVIGIALPSGGIGIAALLGVTGWQLPDFLLARARRAYRAGAEAAIPELLDLVAVSVTAGLTPRLALDRAGSALSGPLATELESARRAVELGESWAAVLRRVEGRLSLRDLRRLSSTLEQSSRLGSPVADRLRGLAREVRAERRVNEEERARRAPVAMLFPLVFLILPAFVLAAVVPTILVATRGIQ